MAALWAAVQRSGKGDIILKSISYLETYRFVWKEPDVYSNMRVCMHAFYAVDCIALGAE